KKKRKKKKKKKKDHKCKGFFLDSQTSSIKLYVCPYARLHCFDYCSFVVSFENGKCESSSFVLFQDCFNYSRSFRFPYKFKVKF
uniref:Uncharacterized protein n=1 Tax=Mustela putorius furo TaxID=9669 RepID=M3YHA3_MUSPF